MRKPTQQFIDQLKVDVDTEYKSVRSELLKMKQRTNPYATVVEDYELYAGYCKEVSEFTLDKLHSNNFKQYQIGNCKIGGSKGTVTHWFVYENFQDSCFLGVIDMTAVQFNDPLAEDDYIKQYLNEFLNYAYGFIPDSHSKKHYIKMN